MDFFKFCLVKNPSLIRYLPKQLSGLLFYKMKFIDKTEFKEIFYCFLQGIEDIDKDIDEFWKRHEKKICAWYIKIKNEDDLIISASPYFLLFVICQRLNVNLIASIVDKKTGEYTGKNCYGKEKLKRFKEEYGKDMRIDNFYSDSYSDEPLMRIANRSYLVKNNRVKIWCDEPERGFKSILNLPL